MGRSCVMPDAAKIVQGERRGKENLVFLSFSEPQPILGGAKVVQGERRGKENLVFLSFSEAQCGGLPLRHTACCLSDSAAGAETWGVGPTEGLGAGRCLARARAGENRPAGAGPRRPPFVKKQHTAGAVVLFFSYLCRVNARAARDDSGKDRCPPSVLRRRKPQQTL